MAICSRLLSVAKASLAVGVVEDLASDDFSRLRYEAAEKLRPEALNCFLTRIRMMFAWAYEADLLSEEQVERAVAAIRSASGP